MREIAFRDWPGHDGLAANSLGSRVSCLRRLETAYGDLDIAWRRDGLGDMMRRLRYSRRDQRSGRPAPAELAMRGDPYNGLAALRAHLRAYRRFAQATAAR